MAFCVLCSISPVLLYCSRNLLWASSSSITMILFSSEFLVRQKRWRTRECHFFQCIPEQQKEKDWLTSQRAGLEHATTQPLLFTPSTSSQWRKTNLTFLFVPQTKTTDHDNGCCPLSIHFDRAELRFGSEIERTTYDGIYSSDWWVAFVWYQLTTMGL